MIIIFKSVFIKFFDSNALLIIYEYNILEYMAIVTY
jgi:hypothetical protein